MKKHETLGARRLNSLGGAGPGEVNQDEVEAYRSSTGGREMCS